MGDRAPQQTDSLKFRSEWWLRYFDGDYADCWPPALDALTEDDRKYRWISRDVVFGIAEAPSQCPELHTAVAAYVWGVNKNVFQVGRLVRGFTRNREAASDKLRTAAAIMAADGPVAAYRAMSSGGVARLPYMGPAYFTKFLYFNGYRNDSLAVRPLILDKRVATALRRREVFPPNAPNAGWASGLYESYLNYCHDLNPADPAAVEIELFEQGRQG